MKNSQEWFFIKISIPETIEIMDEELEYILNNLNYKYKYIMKNLIIIDVEETMSDTDCKLLEETIKTKIKQQSKEEYLGEEYIKDATEEEILKTITASEIIFEFDILDPDIIEEEIISLLSRTSDIEVSEYNTEAEFLKKTDYSEERYTSTPLIHNIRCDNIAVLTTRTLSFDPNILFMGYMKFSNKMKITLKAFNFEMIKYVLGKFNDNFNELKFKDNLDWKRLLSRKISVGYREKDRSIVDNELMKKFLKITKNIHDHPYSIQALEKLLDVGFLTEKEFLEIPSEGMDKSFISHFNHFTRVQKNSIKGQIIWIDSSTGLIFSEKDRTDPKRIQEVRSNHVERIYAPSQNLLYYIRAYWHQEYITDIFTDVKKKWDEELNNLMILEIITDIQFDLQRIGRLEKSSRDIDVLIRIKNNDKQKEYIVAVEAKRNSRDNTNIERDISTKIAQHYLGIFSGFLAISFFKNSENHDYEEKKISWINDGILDDKFLIFCTDTNKIKMEEKIITALTRISEYE